MTTPQDLAAQIETLAKEYRPTMDKDVLHSWASDVQKVAPAIVAAIRQGEEGVVNEADEQASQDAWSDFEDDYLSDGNGGWLDVKIVFACSAAFQEAWPKGRSEAFAAALACIPIPQVAACPAPPPAPDERDDEVRKALRQCSEQFAFYAREHTAAGKHEKAATNQRFADLADAALSPAKGGEA